MAEDRPSFQFAEQIAFFRGKLNLGTATWTDIQHAEHDRAFVVAGALRDDLLTDFRRAVDSAIADGTTLEAFRKDFDSIVARHGWTYNGGRNWRSRVIYETNLRTSYAAGRWAQVQEVKATRPFVRYRHNDSVLNPRPQHVAWDGLVLPVDSPWLRTHWPPNGWGCRCYIETLSQRDLERLGKAGPDTPPPQDIQDVVVGSNGPNPRVFRTPAGVDPGFGYAPGASLTANATPAPNPAIRFPDVPRVPPADALPEPRPADAGRILPAAVGNVDAARAFLAEFGAGNVNNAARFEDVTGQYLTVSEGLFQTAGGPIRAGEEAANLLLIADTLKRPDEVWIVLDGHGVRRRYIAHWQVDGQPEPVLVAIDWVKTQWLARTAVSAADIAELATLARGGERIYRRGS